MLSGQMLAEERWHIRVRLPNGVRNGAQREDMQW